MSYIDGYMAAVPSDRKQDYLEHVRLVGQAFKEHGALRIVENWGDDVPDGETTSFPLAVKCKENETVIFSWIEWPSKEVRDAALENSMQDPRLDPETNPVPFDGTRMIFGGFETILEL